MIPDHGLDAPGPLAGRSGTVGGTAALLSSLWTRVWSLCRTRRAPVNSGVPLSKNWGSLKKTGVPRLGVQVPWIKTGVPYISKQTLFTNGLDSQLCSLKDHWKEIKTVVNLLQYQYMGLEDEGLCTDLFYVLRKGAKTPWGGVPFFARPLATHGSPPPFLMIVWCPTPFQMNISCPPPISKNIFFLKVCIHFATFLHYPKRFDAS